MKNRGWFGVAVFAVSLALAACGGGGGGGAPTTGGGDGGNTGPAGTSVRGLLRIEDTLVGVPFVTVEAYDQNGAKVGSGRTDATGVYWFAVGNSAKRLRVDGSTLPNEVYSNFEFANNVYNSNNANHRPPLPTLNLGTRTDVGTFKFWSKAGPPPPPPTIP